jgi:hypothetical protein
MHTSTIFCNSMKAAAATSTQNVALMNTYCPITRPAHKPNDHRNLAIPIASMRPMTAMTESAAKKRFIPALRDHSLVDLSSRADQLQTPNTQCRQRCTRCPIHAPTRHSRASLKSRVFGLGPWVDTVVGLRVQHMHRLQWSGKR